MSDYLYYRWAGRVVRHRSGDLSVMEALVAQSWEPAPEEAGAVIRALDPDDRAPGGWCARLSQGEAERMVAAQGGTV